MDLDFTTDQDDLRDSVRTVLERECPTTVVRAVVEGTGTADDLWRRMVELDWPSLTVPEPFGGMGFGFVELALVVEELGRVIAPGPFLPTITQFVPAIREAASDEQRRRFLPAVASGDLTGSFAVAEVGGHWDLDAISTVAKPDGDGWALSGEKHYVVEGDAVDELVVAARLEGTTGPDGIAMFVVPVADTQARRVNSLDQTRHYATVVLDGVVVDGDRVLGTPGESGPVLARVIEEATTALALEIVGTCQAILDMTLDYTKERVQFDRPIGSFQAVKHKLVNMFVALERARATCYFSAATIAEDDPRRAIAASVAKAAAGDAQALITKEGIQLHGGIGYTWEHDLHLFVKRAKSTGAVFGTTGEHHERIAELIADRRIEQKGPRWTLDGR